MDELFLQIPIVLTDSDPEDQDEEWEFVIEIKNYLADCKLEVQL